MPICSQPFAQLAEKMGRFVTQIAGGRLSSVEFIYGGELSAYAGSMKFVTRLALKGLLDPVLQQPVNIVNADFIAKERGIAVSETVTQESQRVQEPHHHPDQDRQGRGDVSAARSFSRAGAGLSPSAAIRWT